jgi:hypothetical protein
MEKLNRVGLLLIGDLLEDGNISQGVDEYFPKKGPR